MLRFKQEKKLRSCANWPLPIQQYTQRHWVNTTYLDSQTPKHPLLLASCRRCLLLAIGVGFLRGYIQLVFGVIPRLRPFPSWLGGGSWALCRFRWHDLKSEGVIGKKGISMSGFCACQSPSSTFSRSHAATVVRLKSLPQSNPTAAHLTVSRYIFHMVR